MISGGHRFHGYNSLRHVYRNGQMARGPQFGVKAALNPRRKNYRAAVVVSRKVNKSAVARNRMRRRIYETIRQHEGLIHDPYDIVITVFHNGLLDQPPKALAAQLKKQLKEAGAIK